MNYAMSDDEKTCTYTKCILYSQCNYIYECILWPVPVVCKRMKVEQVNPSAFLDITIDSKPVGRIVVELYETVAPRATKNFLSFCTSGRFKDNCFHRVIKNFVIQAGDLQYGKDTSNPLVGQGNASFEGPLFEDENTEEPLDGPFKLCMANNSPNSNGSQFFITTYPQPHLTGKHTVFGKVIHGKSVVREIEKIDTDLNNVPKEKVEISDCGEWEHGMDVPIFNASYDQIGGDIFEEYPDDDEHIDKESSESVYHASCKIKESGTLLFKKGEKQQAFLKYKKCLRYVMEYIPDEDQEPDWHKKYMELKLKLYLNLSLVCLQLKNYPKTIDYSTYLIEDETSTRQERAKAHFRKGCALIEMRKYKEAVDSLNIANELVENDAAIKRELERAESLLQKKKDDEKKKYAKFFG